MKMSQNGIDKLKTGSDLRMTHIEGMIRRGYNKLDARADKP
jgi:hypothetical protein